MYFHSLHAEERVQSLGGGNPPPPEIVLRVKHIVSSIQPTQYTKEKGFKTGEKAHSTDTWQNIQAYGYWWMSFFREQVPFLLSLPTYFINIQITE